MESTVMHMVKCVFDGKRGGVGSTGVYQVCDGGPVRLGGLAHQQIRQEYFGREQIAMQSTVRLSPSMYCQQGDESFRFTSSHHTHAYFRLCERCESGARAMLMRSELCKHPFTLYSHTERRGLLIVALPY